MPVILNYQTGSNPTHRKRNLYVVPHQTGLMASHQSGDRPRRHQACHDRERPRMYLDATVSMRDHTTSVVSRQPVLESCGKSDAIGVVYPVAMLITCFVFARLDYCNAILRLCLVCDLDRLQAVRNAAVIGSYRAPERLTTWHRCNVKDTGFRSSGE